MVVSQAKVAQVFAMVVAILCLAGVLLPWSVGICMMMRNLKQSHKRLDANYYRRIISSRRELLKQEVAAR
jgi:hypothetical protein